MSHVIMANHMISLITSSTTDPGHYLSITHDYRRYNQCLSPLMLWVRMPFMARCTRYNIMWWSLSVTYDRPVVFSGFIHQ